MIFYLEVGLVWWIYIAIAILEMSRLLVLLLIILHTFLLFCFPLNVDICISTQPLQHLTHVKLSPEHRGTRITLQAVRKMSSLSEVFSQIIVVGMVAAMGEGRQISGADMVGTGNIRTTGLGIK